MRVLLALPSQLYILRRGGWEGVGNEQRVQQIRNNRIRTERNGINGAFM